MLSKGCITAGILTHLAGPDVVKLEGAAKDDSKDKPGKRGSLLRALTWAAPSSKPEVAQHGLSNRSGDVEFAKFRNIETIENDKHCTNHSKHGKCLDATIEW